MSSIKVAVRCRPLFESEKPATGLDIQNRRILLDSKTYDPDYTFGPTCTQDDVLVVARPILQCVKDGLNGTIMVYGQTGTGKTFTMLGQEGADNGLVHKVIAEMLDHLQLKTRDGIKCALTLSMIEIYNEKLTDMLSANGEEEIALINGFPRSTRKTTLCRISDANEAITTGLRWRHTAATMMNDRSSRSHVVFIVDFEQYNEFTEQMDVAHLFLVDLAGSESLKKSQASGATATEAGKINKSLLALKSVFLALSNTSEATRPTHVPYRDSKLTELLQDSIGGTARTLMIACISSVGRDIEETKSTLMYAVKARSIRNAANTEREKLLIRLRSLETENQKIRNRLQERVSERGGYYVTKEEHEASQRLDEEVVQLRESVTQLMHDRQTSDAHQHISESQQKILLVMIEEKEEKIRQFHTVYHDALRRFEHQAGALQRVVQAAVRESKTALQTSSHETVMRLDRWKQQMLAIADAAAADGDAVPVPPPPPPRESQPVPPLSLPTQAEEEEEREGSDAAMDKAGSPTLLSVPAPSSSALMPPLPSVHSRRSSPAPLTTRTAASAVYPPSQRGSIVTTTAPSSRVGSPSRTARALRRGASSSRAQQNLFGGGGGAAASRNGSVAPVHTVSPPPPSVAATAVDEEEPTPVAPGCAVMDVVADGDLLSELDDECRRIAARLNASFRALAEACVDAAVRHVEAVQAIHTQQQSRTQQSLQQLRKAMDDHVSALDRAEQSATLDLTTAQDLFTEETRKVTRYPEPLSAHTLQQLTRGAVLATVRTAESVFPSPEAPPAVQASLDALVKTYRQKMNDTTVQALVPLSSSAVDSTVLLGPASRAFAAAAAASACAGSEASQAVVVMPPLVPQSQNRNDGSSGGHNMPGAVYTNELDSAQDVTMEGSPNWGKESHRSTQSLRGSSVPSSGSTGMPDAGLTCASSQPSSATARAASARHRFPSAPRSGGAGPSTSTSATARKPRLPLAASQRRDLSRGRSNEGGVGRLHSLPGNSNGQASRAGEKRSRSSISTDVVAARDSLSGRQSVMEAKKRRSVSGADNSTQ